MDYVFLESIETLKTSYFSFYNRIFSLPVDNETLDYAVKLRNELENLQKSIKSENIYKAELDLNTATKNINNYFDLLIKKFTETSSIVIDFSTYISELNSLKENFTLYTTHHKKLYKEKLLPKEFYRVTEC